MYETPDSFDFSSMTPSEVDAQLQRFQIRLTADEALAIQHDLLKRPPTFAECMLWSIQGSEHCSYKSTRKHLASFPTQAPHVMLGPKEDAGIVAVATDNQGQRYGIVLSHESHNHPSQIVPYEGAATGVGGNVRDVSCMGAKVIAVADSLRFGRVERAKTQWIQDGVVSGIAGYANPLGIPNLAGDVAYDEGYDDNCLVTVVTLGVVKEEDIIHSFAPEQAEGYRLILVGKPTDNSGFGGAAFASSTLDVTQDEANKGAIQEPNAFLQRHIIKANDALFAWLRERQLISSVGFKDLGAGGIACASVELAEASGYGAVVDLGAVPTSMQGLKPEVILCSETQERFMWVVPEALVDEVLTHYNVRFALPDMCDGAQATVIGKITADKRYVVSYHGQTLVDALASDITQGIVVERPYVRQTKALSPLPAFKDEAITQSVLEVLSHENIACREPIYETYDKQVQGRTIIEREQADAGLLAPFNDASWPQEIQHTGVALAVAQNPLFCRIHAYWGAVHAVLEAIRAVIVLGCWPYALTDCLCFGNPEKPEHMGELVDAIQGIRDVCLSIALPDDTTACLPIVSGNVSLYNDSENGAIPPSPMVACLGRMADYRQAVTPSLKAVGSLLFFIGQRQTDCGGSVYAKLHQQPSKSLPTPDLSTLQAHCLAMYESIQHDLVLSAKNVSRGGMVAALAHMAFKARIGIALHPSSTTAIEPWLFAEGGGFLVEVSRAKQHAMERLLKAHAVDYECIGETIDTPVIHCEQSLHLPLDMAYHTWKQGLRDTKRNAS